MDADKHRKRGHIVVAGKEISCTAPVVLWTDSKVDFKVGEGSRRRSPKVPIDLFIGHWTGGENDVETLVRVLDSRELGVEFAIDTAGNVWQFCDPALVDTFDAGYVNSRSVGVEIVNYGFAAAGRPVPERGKTRPVYDTTLRGKPRRFARFWPVQLGAALALADSLCSALPIPKRLPTDSAGRLLLGTMTPREVRNYRGVLGHFHVSEDKSDPGTEILEHFARNGYGQGIDLDG